MVEYCQARYYGKFMEGDAMSKRTSLYACLTAAICILSISVAASAKTIYVDDDATGANDGTTWVDGDYHLKSQAGPWEANEGGWTMDEVTSLCFDAGDINGDCEINFLDFRLMALHWMKEYDPE